MQVSWNTFLEEVSQCTKCPLAKTRTNVVPGEGNLRARILFVGEGPGRDEDMQGRPFVGAAGKLLDKMIAAIGFSRDDVYIANIVKCRPPQNRVPMPEEATVCLPYLRMQTALIRPNIIVCLGATAAKYIYDPDVRITRARGQWIEKKGVWIMPTYHPAALLRDPEKKREAWSDLQEIRKKYDEICSQS